MFEELIEHLNLCPEFTCSRCNKYGTEACAVKEAIVELKRFDHIIHILQEKLYVDES